MDDSKGSVTHEICGIKAYEELSTLEEPSNSTKVLKKITEKVYANEVNSYTAVCRLKHTFNTQSSNCYETYRHFFIHLGFLRRTSQEQKCFGKTFGSLE